MDADASLRRVERDALVACGVMAGAALALSGGSLSAAVSVLAGGLLIGVSYWSVRGGVTGLVDLMSRGAAEGPSSPPSVAWTVTKLAGRYALLALLAYVMIARLRLHPLGLLAGASSVVAAVSVEALRLLLKKS